MFEIGARLETPGSFRDGLFAAREAVLRANKDALVEAGAAMLADLRADVATSFKSKPARKPGAWAWAMKVHPKGSKLAYNPAVEVAATARFIVESHEFGAQIGGAARMGLMIPIPDSIAAKTNPSDGGSRFAVMVARFGQPRWAWQPDRQSALILFRTRKTGDGRVLGAHRKPRGREAGGFTSTLSGTPQWTPMFIWRRQVTLRPRLSGRAIMARHIDAFLDRWAAAMAAKLGAAA